MLHKIQELSPGRILTLLIVFATLSLYYPLTEVSAIYDPRTLSNNKVGVHILSPDEIDSAARLVNNNGGDWGYVTVPIQPTDRSKEVWQTFMHKANALHLIPIIRITTVPSGGTWQQANDTDLVDFANFLNELDWPVENRYIILFNEVNRSTEWGDTVNPEKYAQIVKNAYAIFKERSPDFFLLGPSLDAALPNSQTSLSAQNYLGRMGAFDPLVWTYFDGWSSHSYPNPAFSAPAKKTGLQSIVGYKSELSLLKLAPKPIFITETGWDQQKVKAELLNTYWQQAWSTWNADSNVVAVTPFLLQGGEQFKQFSLVQNSGDYSTSGQFIYNLQKNSGSPNISKPKPSMSPIVESQNTSESNPFFKNSKALTKLENIFRVVLGLPIKSQVTIKDHSLLVELSQTAKQWEKGLSDRSTLGNLDGMLFIFPHYHIPVFWMKNMHFPIDMIWLSDGKVIDITQNAKVETVDKLPTYSPRTPVNMVLETRAGWVEENGITIGDQLIISE